jgi:hypothetical protein
MLDHNNDESNSSMAKLLPNLTGKNYHVTQNSSMQRYKVIVGTP